MADSHVYRRGSRALPPAVPALFARLGAGLILHAGDVNTAAVLDELEAVAPTLAVRGNNDDAELRDLLPDRLDFAVDHFRFALLHGHQARTAREAARRLAGIVDCVVYGHSHIPKIEVEHGTILFNPGSPTDRRWRPHFGAGLIRVTTERIAPELILFDDPRQLDRIGVDGEP